MFRKIKVVDNAVLNVSDSVIYQNCTIPQGYSTEDFYKTKMIQHDVRFNNVNEADNCLMFSSQHVSVQDPAGVRFFDIPKSQIQLSFLFVPTSKEYASEYINFRGTTGTNSIFALRISIKENKMSYPVHSFDPMNINISTYIYI